MKILWTPQTAKGSSRPLRGTPPYPYFFSKMNETKIQGGTLTFLKSSKKISQKIRGGVFSGKVTDISPCSDVKNAVDSTGVP